MTTPALQPTWRDRILNRSKGVHWLQTTVFALTVAGLQAAFNPDKPITPLVVYSLCIAWITWGVIDLGREGFASARETGWPSGWRGPALVVGGIACGYFVGNALADLACRQFGWYAGVVPQSRGMDLRHSILITAVAGVVGTYYFYSHNKARYIERKMLEARQQAAEAQLKLLETQLEPHMMFNTLANLRVLIAVDPARAMTMLDHMIAYLRATLGASRSSSHPLEAEFGRLRDYLELMAVRMGPRLQYTLDLPADLQALNVPPLLLQPLVENCIKHGLEPQVEGGSIQVSARREGPLLCLVVADTGVGCDPGTIQHGQGFGQHQVRERLATAYGPEASLHFVAEPGHGTRTELRIPLSQLRPTP